MTDLLDKPVGDFEWGPDKRRFLSPWVAIVAGAIIMVAGFALTGLSLQSSTAATPDRATQAMAITSVAPSEPAAVEAQPQSQPSAQQQAQPQPPGPAAVQQARPPGPDAAGPRVGVVVHVTGRVVDPGIVEMPSDARVVHAIEAAGGLLPDADLDSLDLAAYLDDGAQVHVPALSPDRSDTATESSTASDEITLEPLLVTSPTPPADQWGPDEPAPVPPEIEALMAYRETAPDPVVIDDLLLDAGLDPTPPDT